MERRNRERGIMRELPRCWRCLKYEDEIDGNLKKCAKCKMASYCSKKCQRRDWRWVHDDYCEDLIKYQSFKPIMYEDSKGFIEISTTDLFSFYIHFTELAFNIQDSFLIDEAKWLYFSVYLPKEIGITIHQGKSIVEEQGQLNDRDFLMVFTNLMHGSDYFAYGIVKYVAHFRDPDVFQGPAKALKDLREDFLYLKDCKPISSTLLKKGERTTNIQNYFWFVLIIIKVNVIEEMKFLLTQHEAFHRKMKKRFWPHPRIINLYTIYILGTDKESFLQDLEFQENQVKLMCDEVANLQKQHGEGACFFYYACYYISGEIIYDSNLWIDPYHRRLNEYFLKRPLAREYINNYVKKYLPQYKLITDPNYDPYPQFPLDYRGIDFKHEFNERRRKDTIENFSVLPYF